MKDALPDEAFLRLRGTLFFGSAFLVTRNKLTFRDNLQQLLASATPGDCRSTVGLTATGIFESHHTPWPCQASANKISTAQLLTAH